MSREALAVPDGGVGDNWGEWIPLRHPTADHLVLDLSKLTGVGPVGLLRLRALIDWHSFVGKTVEVISPSSEAVREYLARMQLAADLPPACKCDLGVAPATGQGKVLIPIRRLSDVAEGDRLDEELEELLNAQFTGTIGRLAEAFTVTAGEMYDNAASHGRSPMVGAYVSAQRYTKQQCVLAIGDLGVGIPEHIRKARPELTADDDAIRVATKVGVTATGNPHRGFGYQWVIDGMKDTKVPMGELRVWSGKGRFRVEIRDGAQVRRRAWPVDDFTAGTWVRLVLSAQSGSES